MRKTLLVDLALGALLAAIVLIVAPGLAVIALAAILVLVACGISLIVGVRRRRRRAKAARARRRSGVSSSGGV